MLWVVLDVVLGVVTVALLCGFAWSLYRRVRVLTRTVGAASQQVGELTTGLTVNLPPR